MSLLDISEHRFNAFFLSNGTLVFSQYLCMVRPVNTLMLTVGKISNGFLMVNSAPQDNKTSTFRSEVS